MVTAIPKHPAGSERLWEARIQHTCRIPRCLERSRAEAQQFQKSFVGLDIALCSSQECLKILNGQPCWTPVGVRAIVHDVILAKDATISSDACSRTIYRRVQLVAFFACGH